MSVAHLYLVAYDIADLGNGAKRWRHVVKALKRTGHRLQLSLFICRATPRRMARLEAKLRRILDAREDRLMITDLGPAGNAATRIRAENLMIDMSDFEALAL